MFGDGEACTLPLETLKGTSSGSCYSKQAFASRIFAAHAQFAPSPTHGRGDTKRASRIDLLLTRCSQGIRE